MIVTPKENKTLETNMIEIQSNGNQVQITFKTGLWRQQNQDVTAIIECGNPMFSELLSRRLTEKMESAIEAIRKREYNEGIKDGKAKRKKRDWFWTVLKDESYT